jgi:hypothetical protein
VRRLASSRSLPPPPDSVAVPRRVFIIALQSGLMDRLFLWWDGILNLPERATKHSPHKSVRVLGLVCDFLWFCFLMPVTVFVIAPITIVLYFWEEA